MAIGRSRYGPPFMTTKGHSVLKQRSYTMPSRTAPSSTMPRASKYETRAEEYLLADRVSNVNYLSNALMDEGYDTAMRSRGRDQALLKEATNAIVSSESYATPQTSVASRRVARGQSVTPRAASVPPRPPKPEVASSTTATVSQAPPSRRPIVVLPPPSSSGNDRSKSVPPVVIFREENDRQKAPVIPLFTREERRKIAKGRSVPPPVVPYVRSRAYKKRVVPAPPVQEPLPTAGLGAHRVPRPFLTRSALRTGFSNLQSVREEPEDAEGQADQVMRRSVTKARVLASPIARIKSGAKLPYPLPKPRPAPLRESLKDFPKVYVPSYGQRPSNRSKAAIIASKLEPDPIKRRRPRSEFAASKYRELRKEALESTSGGGQQSQSSGSYGYSERRTR